MAEARFPQRNPRPLVRGVRWWRNGNAEYQETVQRIRKLTNTYDGNTSRTHVNTAQVEGNYFGRTGES